MISIRNVTKYYPMKDGKVHYVLKDVSLDLPSGKNIGVLGPNG
jgi:capsular polysaccharide transport system ATP-binding protein